MKKVVISALLISALQMMSSFSAFAGGDKVSKLVMRRLDCLNILEAALLTQGREVENETINCYFGATFSSGQPPLYFILYNAEGDPQSDVQYEDRNDYNRFLYGFDFSSNPNFNPLTDFSRLKLNEDAVRVRRATNGAPMPCTTQVGTLTIKSEGMFAQLDEDFFERVPMEMVVKSLADAAFETYKKILSIYSPSLKGVAKAEFEEMVEGFLSKVQMLNGLDSRWLEATVQMLKDDRNSKVPRTAQAAQMLLGKMGIEDSAGK